MPHSISSVRIGTVVAWFSLALALFAQGGTAIWWAGVQNTRLMSLEERLRELQSEKPAHHRQIIEADRRIAVIDERITHIIARLEMLTAAFEKISEPATRGGDPIP